MLESAAVRIAFVANRSVWQLKTWLPPQEDGTRAILEGQRLPRRVGETGAALGGIALCIGPQQWLVMHAHEPSGAAGALGSELAARALGNELAARGLMALDVTDAFAILEVQGELTRELLAKGCGLDLHPRVFGVGRCARTRFAQIPVILACVDNEHRFELYVARSYAHYLNSWLVDAASES